MPSEPELCGIDGCIEPVERIGLCRKHLAEAKRIGQEMAVALIRLETRMSVIEEILAGTCVLIDGTKLHELINEALTKSPAAARPTKKPLNHPNHN